MCRSNETSAHHVVCVASEPRTRKHFGEMIACVVLSANAKHGHHLIANERLEVSSLDGNVPNIPGQLTTVTNNPGSFVVFANGNCFSIGEPDVQHPNADPFKKLAHIGGQIHLRFCSVISRCCLFLGHIDDDGAQHHEKNAGVPNSLKNAAVIGVHHPFSGRWTKHGDGR